MNPQPQTSLQSALQTSCQLPERFASEWPELMIACDVKGRGEWLHRCSWPPLQLACAAYRPFTHAFHVFWLQTDRQADRQTEGQTWQPGHILRLLPLQAANAKKIYAWKSSNKHLAIVKRLLTDRDLPAADYTCMWQDNDNAIITLYHGIAIAVSRLIHSEFKPKTSVRQLGLLMPFCVRLFYVIIQLSSAMFAAANSVTLPRALVFNIHITNYSFMFFAFHSFHLSVFTATQTWRFTYFYTCIRVDVISRN